MANDPRDNQNDDFDADIFDGEEEYLQDDFDAEAFDEADYAQSDVDDDEFVDDDWQDSEGPEASHQQPREKKGLSFNTIVIIGAVVVGGGVMAMTVMNKSAEQAASSQGGFQSFLNITGVMDGMLFGEKETQNNTAASEESQEGFLNNPDSLASSDNPPQPVPMSPLEDAGPDLGQPLTPLPEDMYAQVPRGPDDKEAVDNTVQKNTDPAAAEAPLSAQDILEQAMANREKKNEILQDLPVVAPDAAVQEEPKVAEALPVDQPADVVPALPAAEDKVSPPVVNTAIMSPAQEKALTDNTKAMETLSESMNKVVSRIDRMEGELTNVRDSQQASYQKLEAKVESLQKEVTALKDRPVSAELTSSPKEEKKPEIRVPVQKEKEPSVKKAETVQPASSKPKAVSRPAPSPKTAPSSAPWELRAAQPGRAWISRAGAKDMQGVQVGQSVDGIGRVTAITYQNGRWTVSGTNGSIQQ